MPYSNDDLWPDFVPVWKKLLDLGAGEMLQIAGGYGLFLKQRWLLKNPDVLIVVPLVRWVNSSPRATSDMDFLLGLEFIAHDEINPEISRLLEENEFGETGKARGKRWQFVKTISDGKDILVELHAPTPGPEYDDLKVGEIRVSRKRSLGEKGINARHNREADGAEMFPFQCNLEGVPLAVPNPVAWSVMKLTAMADFWGEATNAKVSPDDRTKGRRQAEKHARDVFRAVAMMSAQERENIDKILDHFEQKEPFINASTIFERAFKSEGWAIDLVRDEWLPDDFTIILSLLKSWFAPGDS